MLRRPRAWLLALFASLAVHGAWLSWLAQLRPPPARPSPSGRMELELVEISTPTAPEAPPQPSPAPTRRQPNPVRRVRPTAEPAPPAQVSTPAPETSQADPPRPKDSPTLDEPRASVVLTPGLGALPALPDEHPEPEATPPGLHAPPVPKNLVKELAAEAIGRGKVDRGLVHPFYAQLGKALMRSWDADRAVSQKGLKGFVEQRTENAKQWNAVWLENAARFGATGSALGEADGAEARGRALIGLNERAPTSNPNLAAREAVRRQMRDQFLSRRRAILRVIQDRSGRLVSVELVSPSNDSTVDREALADVRRAAEKLPAPPEEAVGGAERITSLWQFELVVSISPPLPTFSFEFDEALKFIDTRLPLDRRIYKKVRLLAVE